MDVHPPHEPIRSTKDFFLHLFTITIGLLIAVGIEGAVEWRHHVHLVQEADASLREEIRFNLDHMNKAMPALKAERAKIDADLEALQRIQDRASDKAGENVSLTADFQKIGLRQTAWKTAESTGALGYMPYDQAQRYADIYQSQQDFLDGQQRIAEDEAALLGLIAKFNLAHEKTITQPQADSLAERYGVWRGHLLYLNLIARLNALNYDAFLHNKPAPTGLHEDLK